MPEAITVEQRKQLSEVQYTMKVSAFEMAFILELRKHTFGRITAVITSGVPFRVEIAKSIMLMESDEQREEVLKSISVEELTQKNETKDKQNN